ncbi:MAG: thioredoxin family protein [Candidatus Nanopelagicaceae bacterium]
MDIWIPILVLLLASAFGIWWQRNQGKLKRAKGPHNFITKSEIETELGQRVTIVQFSSAFCSPCKATAAIISALIKDMSDVTYVQIQSEENLALIEKFDIKSTPTVIFFNSFGMEVGRATGTPTNDQVLAAIASVR